MILRKSFLAAALLLLTLFPQVQIILSAKEAGRSPIQIYAQENLFVPTAHAQVTRGSSSVSGPAQKFFAKTLEIFVVLNWLALSGVQTLLDPSTIFGKKLSNGSRPMELILRNIWVTSRNIVNGIFAFILLVAGIYLIIKSNSEGMGKIKSGIPKFVLAVILVNFSWFFPRVILDMANVLQSVIYQLPTLVDPNMNCIGDMDLGADKKLGGVGANADTPLPCVFVWKVRLFPPNAETCGKTPTTAGCPVPQPSRPEPNRGRSYGIVSVYFTDWKTTNKNGFYIDDTGNRIPVSGADVIINGLAVNMAKLPNMAVVNFDALRPGGLAGKSPLEVAKAYTKFFIFLIMHVIFTLAIGLALLAFMVVLIVRMAVLWLCIGFMPFIFVGYALGGQLGDLKNENAPNIWKIFLGYAFLPAIVAVPFAVGFTLISQLYYVQQFSVALNIPNINVITGVNSFHEFLWMIISIGVIWVGVFSILEKDRVAGGIVRGIKGIGQTGLKAAGYSVGYAPIAGLPRGVLGKFDEFKRLPTTIRFPQRDSGKGSERGEGGDDGAAVPNAQKIASAIQDLKQRSPITLNDAMTQLDNFEAGKSNDFAATHGVMKGLVTELKKSNVLTDGEANAAMYNKNTFRDVMREQFKGEKNPELKINAMMSKFNQHFKTIEQSKSVGIGGIGTGKLEVKIIAEKTIDSMDTLKNLTTVKKALEAHKIMRDSPQDSLKIDQVLTKLNAAADLAEAKTSLQGLR